MTDCQQISPILDAINQARWTCREVAGGRLEVLTDRRRLDSEPVRLMLRIDGDGDTVVASDGGETLAALKDHGFDPADPVLDAVWRELLYEARVGEADGRVFIQGPVNEAASALSRLADACVALYGLQIVGLPPRTRPRTLAGEVEDFLRASLGNDRVKRQQTLTLASGIRVTPALVVTATPNRGQVLVQTGAATSGPQAWDHAYATFGLAARGGVPMDQRLAVLGGSVGSWGQHRLRALADLAFVGFWSQREQLQSFLDGHIPDDSLMLPPGADVPLLA